MVAELEESNLPTELWDGELIRSPAPSFFHQQIVGRFYELLTAWVRKRQLGKTGLAPLRRGNPNRRGAIEEEATEGAIRRPPAVS